jgi:hypothetical protein
MDPKPSIHPPRHVINDQDAVPRGGKLLTLYKRNGHRAIVNRAGASAPLFPARFRRRAQRLGVVFWRERGAGAESRRRVLRAARCLFGRGLVMQVRAALELRPAGSDEAVWRRNGPRRSSLTSPRDAGAPPD